MATEARQLRKTDEFLVYDEAGESYHIIEATWFLTIRGMGGQKSVKEGLKEYRCNQKNVAKVLECVDENTFRLLVFKNNDVTEVLAARNPE